MLAPPESLHLLVQATKCINYYREYVGYQRYKSVHEEAESLSHEAYSSREEWFGLWSPMLDS